MRITFLLFLIVGLSACHGPHIPPEPKNDDLPELGQIELGEAAIAVSSSLQNLAAISAERQVARIEPQRQDQLDFDLLQLASIDWAGPAEPLIQRLAQAVNYHVRVIGKAPPHVIIVNISKHDVTVGELFRDIALQIQRNADLVVFPESKLIEIHYR